MEDFHHIITFEAPVEYKYGSLQSAADLLKEHLIQTNSDNVIVLGAGNHLSRGKARSLAWKYRGSSRGDRYVNYLAGARAGFFIRNNRLVRAPIFTNAPTIIVHACDAVQMLQMLRGGAICKQSPIAELGTPPE